VACFLYSADACPHQTQARFINLQRATQLRLDLGRPQDEEMAIKRQ